MSTVVAAGASTSSAADPTVRQRFRRYRWLALALVFAIVVVVALTIAKSGESHRYLDPRSYDPTGSHALSALLADRGVHIQTDATASAALDTAGAGDTLVVVNPSWLSEKDLSALASTSADLVVVGAAAAELDALGLDDLDAGGAFEAAVVAPSCDLSIATIAGTIAIGTESNTEAYRAPRGGVGCYPVGDGAALVAFDDNGRRITLLGDPAVLSNKHLADEGNAALALGLLSSNPTLVWLSPAVIGATSDGPHATVVGLLPSRLKWAVLQLAIAVGILAVWRARRLGKLVPEALPVVVRQAETVVGRARLYRRSRSLGRAAETLRTASRQRLSTRLGFGPSYQSEALSDAISRRTGKPAREIDTVLYGPTPGNDRELVALAGQLARLEQEVRGS